MFNVNLSGFAGYPPCVNRGNNQDQDKYKYKVLNQLERRIPPIILTTPVFEKKKKLWLRGKQQNKNLLQEESFIEYPQITENLTRPRKDVGKKTIADTPTQLTHQIMLDLKTIAEEEGRLHQDYHLTNPLALDVSAFDTKGITYFTNALHTGVEGASSGSDHAKTLEKGFGLTSTPESINKIYNKLCNRLLCPETDLYKVDYTEYGIRCRYISAFTDFKDPSRLTYLFHSWQTNYFIPEKEDLDVLIARKGANFSIEDPFIDGWNRLLTLFCKSFGELKKGEKDFVRRRNLITDQDVKLIYPNAQEASENWRIPNKSVLLANSTNWRKALPSIETGKNYGFVELPESHYTYNSLFYSSNIFEPSLSAQEAVATLPYGDFYGINYKI